MNKKLHLASSLALALAMSCYATSGFASNEITEQVIDNNQIVLKFRQAMGAIETAVDSDLTEDSQQLAHNSARRIIQEFSEPEARDFFNYLIGFRLSGYDLSPTQYSPQVRSFYEIASEMNLSEEFKGMITGYKEAYEEKDYSEEQLSKIEQILRNHPSLLQFHLIDDALSLCRQKVHAMAQDEKDLQLADFKRIIQLIELRKGYLLPDMIEDTQAVLEYKAVAYFGLQEKALLSTTLKQMARYRVPKEELYNFISKDKAKIYTLVKKYY